MKSSTENLIRDVHDEVIRWRRHIHANPDLSFQEKPTADFIARELANLPELTISRPLKNSVVAVLQGENPARCGHCVLISTPCRCRKSGEAFSSTKPGVMHACGHDAHTAMLMGAAKVLLPPAQPAAASSLSSSLPKKCRRARANWWRKAWLTMSRRSSVCTFSRPVLPVTLR